VPSFLEDPNARDGSRVPSLEIEKLLFFADTCLNRSYSAQKNLSFLE
jgi:hypothetical protein